MDRPSAFPLADNAQEPGRFLSFQVMHRFFYRNAAGRPAKKRSWPGSAQPCLSFSCKVMQNRA
jgi:hypothetical protein